MLPDFIVKHFYIIILYNSWWASELVTDLKVTPFVNIAKVQWHIFFVIHTCILIDQAIAISTNLKP